MKRTARIKAMKILYAMDLSNMTLEQAKDFVMEEEYDEVAVELVEFCVANLAKIDQIINIALTNYTLDRLNQVDKAIVRLATSELLNKTPKQVVINEALEITKIYSDEGDHKATSFNNRLLDTIAKRIE